MTNSVNGWIDYTHDDNKKRTFHRTSEQYFMHIALTLDTVSTYFDKLIEIEIDIIW